MAKPWKAVVADHGFRYYDPEIGRYLTRDPAGYVDGLNVYLYVGNNPINHMDPEGLAGRETDAGVKPSGVDHHVEPVKLWDEYGFDAESQRVFNAHRIAVPEGTRHGATAHGHETGYTRHVEGELQDFMTKRGVTDITKLSPEDRLKFAKDFCSELAGTKNGYIRTFNRMVGEGASAEKLRTWYSKRGQYLKAKPLSEGLMLAKYARLANAARWATRAVTAVAPVFAIYSYQEAKAADWSDDAARVYAGIDFYSPVPLPTASFLGSVNAAVDARIAAPFDEFREAGHRSLDPNASNGRNVLKFLKEFEPEM